ncbi:MAG: Holliday junction resolvase Hjc [archaeon]
MTRYQKGANAERELIKELYGRGLSVVRVAGSGKNSLPMPDIVALSKTKKLVFECKAWGAAYLNLSIEQMDGQIGWARRSNAEFFVVWKVPRKGFLFLNPKDFVKAGKNYVISLKKAQGCALDLRVVLGEQSRLEA